MKQASSTQKTVSTAARLADNEPVAGAQGVALEPPAYGLDMVDQPPIQRVAAAGRRSADAPQTNKTGLPDSLKAGIEQLSGLALDDVRVHYNSAKPSQLQALAYTQGTNIHIAPGQERHLPHEAWHVVQQKQGRVRPTRHVNHVAINDEQNLEREANRAGRLSAAMGSPTALPQAIRPHSPSNLADSPVQRVIHIGSHTQYKVYKTKNGKDTNALIDNLEKSGASWKLGWKTYVRELAADKNNTYTYGSEAILGQDIDKRYKKQAKTKIDRPGFVGSAEKLGKVTKSLQTDSDQSDFKPGENDAALPHRFPYSDIRDSVLKFVNGTETQADLERWSDRLYRATEQRKTENLAHTSADDFVHANYEQQVDQQLQNFLNARNALIQAKTNNAALDEGDPAVVDFIKWTNSLHGNIPDYGPQNVNAKVSNRLHPNFRPDGSMTPGTEAAFSMTPTRVSKGYATTQEGGIVTTGGLVIPFDQYGTMFMPATLNLIKQHIASETTIQDEDLELMESDNS